MIEGLTVTVGGSELADLCRKRSYALLEFAKKNRAMVLEIDDAAVAVGKGYTSSNDPREAMRQKAQGQESEAQELAFIADHLLPDESYQLDSGDLMKLGIVRGF